MHRLMDTRRMMSEESTTPDPVELTRQATDAMNRGDLDAAMSYAAPDMVLEPRHGFGTFEDATTIRGFIEDWVGAYEELEFVFEDLLDVGNGVVLAVVSQKARPVGTTGYVRQCEGWVWLWVEGLIASLTAYPEADIDEARAAAERLAQERG
jgi:ketosteroid isomerase-like protein